MHLEGFHLYIESMIILFYFHIYTEFHPMNIGIYLCYLLSLLFREIWVNCFNLMLVKTRLNEECFHKSLWTVFLEMGPVGLRTYSFVVWTDIAKSFSTGMVPTCYPTGHVWDCLFPHSPNNKVYFSEWVLIFIKQISRMRELSRKKFVLYLKSSSIFRNHFLWAETTEEIFAVF